MSFEQQYSGNDQVNVKDRAAETNPQLNLIDLQNGSQKCGQDASRNNGSADQHLPGLSIYDGGDGAHSHHSDRSSAETSMTGGGNNATSMETTANPTLASGQSSEAGMSSTAQSTASGASEGNILQNLQTDLTNLGNVMQQFTTDLTSAETGLAQLGDTQQPSTTGSDNAGTTGSTDSNSSNGASFMQQLQSLMNYLGIPSANNSSSESTAGTPASNSDTTPPASTISTAAGDAPPVVNNGTQPTDSTKPTTAQNNNPGNAPSTNDGTPTNNTAATDPIFNALQAQSPEAAQILSASQPNMSAAGYSNFESALSQTVNGGQYTDVASAGAAAALMLQQSGDSSDSAIAVNAINSVINQNGDAQLGNSTTPPADTTTTTPPADTTTTTPPADTTTTTPPADTTTTTPPADTTTTTPPADTTTTTPPADTTTTTPPADTTTTTPPADTTTTTPPASTANNGGLYVQGNQIMDNGTPFVPNGINDSAPTEHEELEPEMGTIASQGADMVRIIGQASDLEGGPNDAFNQEVQSALNAGLKVDLTWNTDAAIYGGTGAVPSASDVTEGSAALYAAAAEWGNNPNVIYNVVNEAGASGDANNSQLLSDTTSLIGAVRAGAQSVNPNANPVVVVDDSEWGQAGFDPNYQSQSFALNNLSALESAANGQLVIGEHDYQSGNSYTDAGLEAIQAAGVPVFTEEFGGGNQPNYPLAEQTSSVTGEPIGGLVWVDGNDPTTGAFYNNILNDSNLAPQVQNYWSTIDSEAAAATPTAS